MRRLQFPAAFLSAPILLALVFTTAKADIYRWVDDEGVVHYTQNPPNDRDSTRVEGADPPAEDPEASRKRLEQLNEDTTTEVYKRQLEREAEAEEAERTEQNASRCRELRDKRNKLANSPKVRAQTEDGDYRVLPYEERQQKLAEYDKLLADRCGNQ